MPRKQSVLVIEDNHETRDLLDEILRRANYESLLAEDGLTGLRTAYASRPDAIILDVMMPGLDGFTVCERLRELTDAPILFLTGKATSTGDSVKAFALGADDFLIKPFRTEELLSRLRVRLRRSEMQAACDEEYLSAGESVALDRSRHELTVNGHNIYLRPKEFEVLDLLVRHAGHVLSPNAILSQVWGSEHVGEPDLVKQYVYRIRKKVQRAPEAPQFIHSVRGSGYYFEAS